MYAIITGDSAHDGIYRSRAAAQKRLAEIASVASLLNGYPRIIQSEAECKYECDRLAWADAERHASWAHWGSR